MTQTPDSVLSAESSEPSLSRAMSAPPVPNVSAPPRAVLYAVALLSACVLGFEVSLTRVFGTLLRYHFAFLAISLALCGLGLGGCITAFARRRRNVSLPAFALAFGVSIVLVLAIMLRGIFAFRPDLYWLSGVLVLVPFTLAGVFLAEAFARYPKHSGQLYAWDLAGAALAAVGVIGLLQLGGAIDSCLWIAALCGLCALLLAEKRAGAWIGAACVALVLLPLFNARLKVLDVPPMPPMPDENGMTLADRSVTQPLYTELGSPNPPSKILATRQNAFARTDVVEDKQSPGSLLIYTNGNVPTNMMLWNGKTESLPGMTRDFPLSDWAFEVAPLRGKSVFSIGPGGGLDALLSLRYGAKSFDGAELNPSIVGLMRDYRKENGGIYEREGMEVQTADGRALLRQNARAGKRYALIFSALTKTATAGQGMALLESFIHTQNAFSDYLNALGRDGQMTILGDNPLLLARFFATAVAELKSRGMTEQQACRHIAMTFAPQPGPYVYAIVVSKSPLSQAQTTLMADSARRHTLLPLWLPGQPLAVAPDSLPPDLNTLIGLFQAVGQGRSTIEDFQRFFREARVGSPFPPLDVSPSDDDRPFVLDLSLSPFAVFEQSRQLSYLLGAGVLVLVAFCVATIFGGKHESTGEVRGSRSIDALYTLYFLALGVGFMLVEIPLAQKLILPLGYPVLALTTVLFALLLGGGAGAAWAQRFSGRQLREQTLKAALSVSIAVVVFALFGLQFFDAILPTMPLLARCVVASLFLFPLGFIIGQPFPAAMRNFARHGESRVPIVWGLNGVASVLGSVMAALGAKQFGFTTVMLVGAVVYLIAAGLLALIGRGEGEATTETVVSGSGKAVGVAEEKEDNDNPDNLFGLRDFKGKSTLSLAMILLPALIAFFVFDS